MSDLDFPILLVHDPAEASPAIAEGVRYIAEALAAQGLAIVNARGEEEAELIVKTRPELSCVLMSWDDPDHDPGGGRRIERMIRLVREIQESLPIFLLTESLRVDELPHEVLQETSGYVWITEDKPEFSAGRIARAAEGYRRSLMPPFFRRLYDYVNEFKDAWHTPGHSGGLAFLKSPVGKIFYDFYGPNIFLTDLCSSVPEMGSLLEHQGVIREAEDEAAEAHGADRTFFVTNGTTMSNQIVHRALLKAGDVVVVDRNCYKSVINACIMTGAIPVFLPAHRNGQGIIGPARWEALDPEAIRARVAAHPLVRRKAGAVDPGAADAAGGGRVGSGAAEAAAAAGRDGVGVGNGSADSETGLAAGSSRVPAPRVKMVVITNSTYDGVLYNAERLLRRLEGVADYIHMDEAWIPYAAFHPLYRRHYGLSPATRRKDLPTVISTVSTHKVLSAFSQASMIHIRNGRRPIDEDRFNEAFMMHTSTSPQYAILASLDVGTRMMMGKAGERLVQEAVERALEFRRQVYSIHREAEGRGDWWFNVWQPETVEAVFAAAGDVPGEGLGGDERRALAGLEGLTRSDAPWQIRAGDRWHGFEGVPDGFAMLDPIKVTILTPGVDSAGRPEATGIPGPLVAAFLRDHGVVAEKTGFYTLLVLFTIAASRSKSSTLVSKLYAFKQLYDSNRPVKEALPEVYRANPGRYRSQGVKDLAQEMHDFLREAEIARVQEEMYAFLPEAVLTPTEAFGRLVDGEVELVPLEGLPGRVSAVIGLVYPPGIPVIVPGERFDEGSKAIIEYLRLFEAWDNRFPGFEMEVQGVVKDRRAGDRVNYRMYCVRD